MMMSFFTEYFPSRLNLVISLRHRDFILLFIDKNRKTPSSCLEEPDVTKVIIYPIQNLCLEIHTVVCYMV